MNVLEVKCLFVFQRLTTRSFSPVHILAYVEFKLSQNIYVELARTFSCRADSSLAFIGKSCTKSKEAAAEVYEGIVRAVCKYIVNHKAVGSNVRGLFSLSQAQSYNSA